MSQLFEELKRRNVFRVAIAYLAVAWLILQLSDIVLENIGTPDWVMKTLMFVLAIGFPLAVLFAWAYEMTPDGIKREKDVDRSQSITGKTGQKLNRTITAVLVAAVAFLLVDKFVLQDESPEVTVIDKSVEKSVAVLPFVAMSRGENDEYFADGLTEEILNSLTRVPELLVTARTSAFHFKGQDIPIPEIAQKLGVAHVVEGSVRRDGERLRVTAQLIRAIDGFHLWSENYDRDSSDSFGVQTDIAEKIATALDIVLDEDSLARMRAVGLQNPEAYIAYQKGLQIYNESHGSWEGVERLQEANAFFEEALRLEPGLGRAHILHSDYYAHYLMESLEDETVSDDERDAAHDQLTQDLESAVRIASTDEERLVADFDLAVLTGHWQRILPLLEQLEEQTDCVAPAWIDILALPFERAQAVADYAEKMIECDPLDYSNWYVLAYSYMWTGDTDKAIERATRGLESVPHRLITFNLILALLAEGRFDDAKRIVDRDVRDELRIATTLATIAAAKGDRDKALSIFDHSLAPDMDDATRAVMLARAGLRDQVNTLVSVLDSGPYGYLALAGVPTTCLCGAPWDIEFTPNFAARLEDANLRWPPASPIDWPLKDW